MAQRFGGKYSPRGTSEQAADSAPPPNRFRGQTASSVDVRSLAMFVFPTPLLFAALAAVGDSAIGMVGFLVAYAMLMFGAFLLREGQKAEAEYDARTIAKPPAFPRKICAAALAGTGVFMTMWMAAPPTTGGGFAQIAAFGGSLINAAIFGAITTAAHLATFGLDPMKAKGMEDRNIDAYEMERVTDALGKAEAKLKSIEALAHKLHDRDIDRKVSALNATVRQMIKLVEEDPRDLSRARKYLGVYLKGAEDATRKYANSVDKLDDPKLRTDYLALLSDLDAGFQRGKESLLIDDRADLEVEIEVLRERLEQEIS